MVAMGILIPVSFECDVTEAVEDNQSTGHARGDRVEMGMPGIDSNWVHR